MTSSTLGKLSIVTVLPMICAVLGIGCDSSHAGLKIASDAAVVAGEDATSTGGTSGMAGVIGTGGVIVASGASLTGGVAGTGGSMGAKRKTSHVSRSAHIGCRRDRT